MAAISYALKTGNPGVAFQGTDPVAYTPTYSASFGTVTTSYMQWRRVGSCIHIAGRFTTGTVTAVLASVSLPNGLTAASMLNGPGLYTVGKWARNTAAANAAKQGVVNVINGQNFFTFSRDDYTTADSPGNAGLNASTFIGNSEVLLFDGEIIIPIFEWQNQANQSQGAGTATPARPLGLYQAGAAPGSQLTTAIPVGSVGEMLGSLSGVDTSVSSTTVNLQSLTLSTGEWTVYANVQPINQSALIANYAIACINTASAVLDSSATLIDRYATMLGTNATNSVISAARMAVKIKVTAPTQIFYLNGVINVISGTGIMRSVFYAIRNS